MSADIDSIPVGARVIDAAGRMFERTGTAWRGLTPAGKPTGDVLTDKVMQKQSLRVVEGPAARVAEPAVAPPTLPTGIVHGLTFEEYNADPGLRSSALKVMRQSPAHYRHALTHPRTSSPMRLGTAAHVATLEPDRFRRSFAVWDRKTDTGRSQPRSGAAWVEFEAAAVRRGQTVITEAERDGALAIAEAVRSNPDAARYLRAGEPEVSMFWNRWGRRCKGRADWTTMLDGADCVVGLKTARAVEERAFGSQAWKLGYHMQWSFYHDGWQAIHRRPPFMVEIVVESAEPHCVAVYELGEDWQDKGREDLEACAARLAECERTGLWPGPVDTERPLPLPAWLGETYELTVTSAED
jgi:hypothetical protein